MGLTPAPLAAPVPLTAAHDPAIDDWLKRRALRNETTGASRTDVVCAVETVVGYSCLAAGTINRDAAPRPVRRTMPDPIPVMVAGRLAVDRTCQGQRIGQALLRDVILRVLHASEIAGITAFLSGRVETAIRLLEVSATRAVSVSAETTPPI